MLATRVLAAKAAVMNLDMPLYRPPADPVLIDVPAYDFATIYLSDPHRAAPSKMRTALRQPVDRRGRWRRE
jgi:cytochrome c